MDNGQLERVSVCLVFGSGCNGIVLLVLCSVAFLILFNGVDATLVAVLIPFNGVGAYMDNSSCAQDCFSIIIFQHIPQDTLAIAFTNVYTTLDILCNQSSCPLEYLNLKVVQDYVC